MSWRLFVLDRSGRQVERCPGSFRHQGVLLRVSDMEESDQKCMEARKAASFRKASGRLFARELNLGLL